MSANPVTSYVTTAISSTAGLVLSVAQAAADQQNAIANIGIVVSLAIGGVSAWQRYREKYTTELARLTEELRRNRELADQSTADQLAARTESLKAQRDLNEMQERLAIERRQAKLLEGKSAELLTKNTELLGRMESLTAEIAGLRAAVDAAPGQAPTGGDRR